MQPERIIQRRIAFPLVQPGKKHAGFSLVELLVVVAIILVVAAFAVPNIMTTMDAYRLRGALTNIVGITQRSRVQAVRLNNTERLHVILSGNTVVLYYKPANSGNPGLQTTDPQLPLAMEFSIPGLPAGPPQLTGVTMWGSNVPFKTNSDPYFNSRGLPWDPVARVATGYVYYFKYKRGNRVRWAALSISPAGRIQNWFWSGTTWGN